MVKDLAFSRRFSCGNIDMSLDIKTKGALLMHFSAYHQQVYRRRKKSLFPSVEIFFASFCASACLLVTALPRCEPGRGKLH
jgi:hypothetical protein